MKLFLFAFLAPVASGFLVSSTTDSMVPSSETVDYVCEMSNMWSSANHPINYPASSAHWSPPVLAAHSSAYTMWESGGMASTGVENVAELGSTSSLNSELSASPDVGDVVIGNNAFNNQITTQTFSQLEMDSTNKYFSMVSMVAPSPDWFTGFYNFEAVKASTDKWYREFVITTFPWDAGTENGASYSLGNAPTNPQEPISQLTVDTVPSNGVLLSPDGSTVRPVSSFSCTLQQPDPDVPPPSELSFDPFDVVSKKLSLVASTETVDYTCVFQNNWSAVNHPNFYPGSAHWSPPILAAHSAEYTMWEEGGVSSSGVESVAETGGTSSLINELDTSSEVGARETGSTTFNNQVQMQSFDTLEMTPATTFLSTITMIAPSPDWFSGFYNFDAIDDVTSTWYREFIISTYPWDAGTEDGEGYSGSNPATSPTEPIKRFNPNNLPSTNVFLSNSGTVLPVATWTCTLEQPDPVTGFPACFSSRAIVEVEGKGKVSMEQLQIGDHVRVDEKHFERVYSFGHKSKTEIGSYLQIFADDLKDPLEISRDHMLFVNIQKNKMAVPASTIKTGDFLVMSSGTLSLVKKVSTVERRGAFAPFTMSGKIVVNGVVSSSYVSLQGTDNVMIGNTKTPLGSHFIAHLLTTPLRIAARLGLLNHETYTLDGRSSYIAGPHYAAQILLEQRPVIFGAVFSVAVTIMAPLLAVEILFARSSVCFLAIAAAWYFYY